MRVEIYADLTPKQLLDPGTVARVARLQVDAGGLVDGLRVVVDSAESKPRWGVAQLKEAATEYRAKGFELRAAHWPHEKWGRPEQARMIAMRTVTGMPSVYDCEHNANSHRERKALRDLLLPVAGPHDIVTTHPWHPERGNNATILPNHRREIQAYSTGTSLSRDPRSVPGEWQERLAGLYPGDDLALAAYGQVTLSTKLGVSVRTLMDRCYDAAVEAGVPTVSYWSLRHVLKNAYAYRFLSQGCASHD